MSGRIFISEVGPRDGLQIERQPISAADKIALVDALSATGIPRIEVSSFAHPKIVPQLADAAEVLAGITRKAGVRYAAYAPNVKGAERALAAGVDDLKAGLAASETFNRLNVRMSTADAVRAFGDIAAAVRGSDTAIVAVIGTAFGCPYEGPMAVDQVFRLVESLVGAGARLLYFADTTGMANPRQITALVDGARRRWPEIGFGLHLHNTRGLGIANALAGLEAGVRDFESSIGGLGGCPYAPKAVGNICTEDFVHMLQEMGFGTGIDLDALIDAARMAERILGRVMPGMVMKAGKASQLHDPSLTQT